MRKLTIRKRDRGTYEVGPAGIGPTAVVRALSKPGALAKAREQMSARQRDIIRNLPTAAERRQGKED